MRVLAFGAMVLALGCGAVVTEKGGEVAAPAAEEESAPARPIRPAPRDLRTRKTGVDWPCFLGPTGDSVSSEKGILVPWPKKGPRLSSRP